MEKNKVPIKNIGSYMVDVKRPDLSYSDNGNRPKVNLSGIDSSPFKKTGTRRYFSGRIWVVSLVVVFLAVGLFSVFNIQRAKGLLTDKSSRILDNFNASFYAFRSLDFDRARNGLTANDRELSSLGKMFGGGNDGVFSLKSIISVLPVLRDAGAVLGGIGDLNIGLIRLSDTFDDLKTNGFHYFQNNGSAFVEKIDMIRALLHGIAVETQSVRNATANLKNVSKDFSKFDELIADGYVAHISELQSIDNFLKAFKSLLVSEKGSRLALFFFNPSEIRPGGGFLGSYGVLSINNGQMSDLEVQDIYWPDHPINFDAKVIPPEPLQGITRDWGARDGNWFFDFPSSAETILGFLERSKIYKEKEITFDGAIALNINVLKSIIHITGPIDLPDYDLDINEDNFLVELQREVESGRDKQPGKNPKKILSVLMPIILERVSGFENEKKTAMFEAFTNHISKKDIMFFSRNKDIAHFLADSTIDGRIYELPSSFWGAYLAVVNANIAGGKSDAFIKENISVRVDVDSDGGSFVDLSVTRAHSGDKERDSWWRATNKDFIQIFTNPASSLGFLKGNDLTIKLPKNDYLGAKHESNTILESIEKTKKGILEYNAWSYEAFGKRVYAAWFLVSAGKTKTLEMRYEIPTTKELDIKSGKIYKVVFDRQSGVASAIKIVVNAPLGYQWAESQSPVYVFESENPDSRVVLDLTLSR